jgi:hypothetical protein
MAAACLGFAAVNVVFEATGHFANGRYAAYAPGFAVMDWLVVVLKVLGAAVALLSVAPRQRILSTRAVAVSVWGAFGTLAVYAVGGVVEAVGMVTGLSGSIDEIDLASVGYLLCFLAAATGFGVLAVSYSGRHPRTRGPAVLGVLVGPLVLGLVLLLMPAVLRALGLFPGAHSAAG